MFKQVGAFEPGSWQSRSWRVARARPWHASLPVRLWKLSVGSTLTVPLRASPGPAQNSVCRVAPASAGGTGHPLSCTQATSQLQREAPAPPRGGGPLFPVCSEYPFPQHEELGLAHSRRHYSFCLKPSEDALLVVPVAVGLTGALSGGQRESFLDLL